MGKGENEYKNKPMVNWRQLREKYGRKTVLFLAGWFTLPTITGGWLYDLFGTSDWSEIWYKIMHPENWLDAFTVYTIAFLTFDYLPDKITKRNVLVKLFYFVCYYLVLLKIVGIVVD